MKIVVEPAIIFYWRCLLFREILTFSPETVQDKLESMRLN
jgi:hypothetical protein